MLTLKALFALLAYDVLSSALGFNVICQVTHACKIKSKRRDYDIIEDTCKAIDYACIWYPKPALCLQRSFALIHLLRRAGVPAELVLGAQKLPFRAHAWVEVEGQPINERSNVRALYAVWDRY